MVLVIVEMDVALLSKGVKGLSFPVPMPLGEAGVRLLCDFSASPNGVLHRPVDNSVARIT